MLIVGISLSAAPILIDSMTSVLSEADRRAEIGRRFSTGGAKPHEHGLSPLERLYFRHGGQHEQR